MMSHIVLLNYDIIFYFLLFINCCFRLQAGDGVLGAAADQDAGQQVQRSRHGEHQEHEGEQRQGEEGLHSREAHLQDELIQNKI